MTYMSLVSRLLKHLPAKACATALLCFCAIFSSQALAFEPVKISRDDNALDLTATTDIYAN
ncbi:hypothetical protein, partial [Agrobacterium cavarae]